MELLRLKLSQRLEVESAWHIYRAIVAEFTSAVRNRTPGLGWNVPAETGKTAKAAVGTEAGGRARRPPKSAGPAPRLAQP